MVPSEALLDRYAPLKAVAGCRGLVAHQAEDIFALWQAWEEQRGEECQVPFWAVVWPGGVVLARYLLRDPGSVSNQVVLDLGCGGGLAGIAAAKAGAKKVIANDIDPVALHIATCNAEANGVRLETEPRELTAHDDWGEAKIILVADHFYQRDHERNALPFLRRARQRGTRVIIADGGRNFAPRSGISLLGSERITVNHDLEGVSVREVRLLSLLD